MTDVPEMESNVVVIVIVVLASLSVLGCIITCSVYCCCYRKRNHSHLSKQHELVKRKHDEEAPMIKKSESQQIELQEQKKKSDDNKVDSCVVKEQDVTIDIIEREETPTVPEEAEVKTIQLQPARLEPDTEAVIKKVIALHPYKSIQDGDIDLDKGQVYEVIDESKEQYIKVRNRTGDVGNVPANYVEGVDKDKPEYYGWYYKGVTSLRDCEVILRKENKESCFMVRDSMTGEEKVLCLFTKEVENGIVRQYKINKNEEGKWWISKRRAFDTIPELIDYHQHNSDILAARLRTYPSEGNQNTMELEFGEHQLKRDDIDLCEEVGTGQFGVVYRGVYQSEKEVAVKTMQKDSMHEDDFISEAKIMMRYQHPNIVKLYGVVSETRPIWIVTEYMINGSLQNYLKANRDTLLENNAILLSMCLQICDAMQYLESKQCIHRDLATRNCLVGNSNLVKVADFGLARYVKDDEYISSQGAKFPARWAAPEVFSELRFSSKSDVWAFGVTLWEIWKGGSIPYFMWRNPQIAHRVCKEKYRLEKPDTCPDAMYKIMSGCWKEESELRPSFQVLFNELETLQPDQDNYIGAVKESQSTDQ